MGYCYSVNDSSFSIPSANYTDLMDHLIKWHTTMKNATPHSYGLKWIDHDKMLPLLEAGDILEYFALWLYEAKIDITTGNICGLRWTGEKIGDEEKLFEQIAPWVEDASFFDCQGEDGSLWRWIWRDGHFYHVEAEILYPDPVDAGYIKPTPSMLAAELEAARKAAGWPTDEIVGTDVVIRVVNGRAVHLETQYALNALRGKNVHSATV
jgi:hypothetical protein